MICPNPNADVLTTSPLSADVIIMRKARLHHPDAASGKPCGSFHEELKEGADWTKTTPAHDTQFNSLLLFSAIKQIRIALQNRSLDWLHDDAIATLNALKQSPRLQESLQGHARSSTNPDHPGHPAKPSRCPHCCPACIQTKCAPISLPLVRRSSIALGSEQSQNDLGVPDHLPNHERYHCSCSACRHNGCPSERDACGNMVRHKTPCNLPPSHID
mmetsp:Transcript_41525/g.88481  ORF Transcript_41525/g.88481 Transcript_41525/m.88481 type:complete len:216 (+) Transcript_41525:3-650(+)